MKIAIHDSGGFALKWIEYCKNNDIDYKLVNAYDNAIISQIKDCDAFMWHFNHLSYKDAIFSKQLLFSIQQSGKLVFPNFNSAWHFDDKVGQKYLLESINAPFVKSYVFYTRKEALRWIEGTSFPKVFKLRGGAGSSNVKLIHTKKKAKKIVNRAFRKGFYQSNPISNLNETWIKYRSGLTNFKDVIKKIVRLFIKDEYSKMHSVEKGYVYFQEFIPNNTFDTRLVVIDGKYAFGEKRYVRENDFRASGSGTFSFNNIDKRIVQIGFEVAKKLQIQSVAFDFIYDKNNNPLIIEISYAFGTKGISYCPGYWTEDMEWHSEKDFDFYGWMVESLINSNKY